MCGTRKAERKKERKNERKRKKERKKERKKRERKIVLLGSLTWICPTFLCHIHV